MSDEGFNPEAATAAAEAVSPDGANEAPPAAAPAAPAPSGAPAPAPGPGGTVPNVTRPASLVEEAIVNFSDQGVWMLTKRHAKKTGLWPKLTANDKKLLRMNESEKEELVMFAAGVVPMAAKYADLIEKISLGLFAFALYSIYEDKKDVINRAVELDAGKSKGPAGFVARGGAAPAPTFNPPGPDGIKPHGA